MFIQFGHNDECRTPETADRATYTKKQLTSPKLDSQGKNAQGQYSFEFYLMKYYVDMAAATIKLCKDSSAATSAKYYAYADTAKKTRETMHLSSTGATKVASLIAQDTKKLGLTLSKNLR